METFVTVVSTIAAYEFGKFIYRAVKRWWIETWSI